MWNDRKPWWQRKAKENQEDKSHYKNWCVIEMKEVRHELNNFTPTITHVYRPCAMLNAPKWFTAEGEIKDSMVMKNLTKQEAHECAKGLNFFEE